MNNPGAAEKIAKEYEDFVYIVSHDLKAPLRHVKEFTRLLITARGGGLKPEEQEYVAFLEKSLERLDRMQESLLVFSRLGTRPAPAKETPSAVIIEQALKDMDLAPPPSIEYNGLPSITVDTNQFRLLFSHLVGNAIKFQEPGNKPEIKISARHEGNMFIFEIRDNGIGIPQEQRMEVFRMFRRLQPEKYPGNGAGLTLARKIVERHGGEIWIESEPGKGAGVFFSVPK